MFSSDSKVQSEFEYEGVDLEAMSVASNYYRWIIDTIKKYVGDHIVEVGAGVGSFSKFLQDTKPKTLTLLEPSAPTHTILQKNMQSTGQITVRTINKYLKGAEKELAGKADTFVYINVFEHIEDDKAELQRIAKILTTGGHAIIFVPAMRGLYSDFDKSIGHYRRYDKKRLHDLCEAAGLEVVKTRYMDMAGMLPWWFSFVLMKRTTLVPTLVKVYDGFCVPIIRTLEAILEAPVGKNVLLIAKKR